MGTTDNKTDPFDSLSLNELITLNKIIVEKIKVKRAEIGNKIVSNLYPEDIVRVVNGKHAPSWMRFRFVKRNRTKAKVFQLNGQIEDGKTGFWDIPFNMLALVEKGPKSLAMERLKEQMPDQVEGIDGHYEF